MRNHEKRINNFSLNQSHETKSTDPNIVQFQNEESRFENLSKNKKEFLLKNYISNINLDKLEIESNKILEEEMDIISLVSDSINNSTVLIK